MEKGVKVQLTVSYDRIRQVMCVLSGKVLSDSDIDELVGNDVLDLDTNAFGEESNEGIEQVICALILSQTLTDKTKSDPIFKSKFEERLEAMNRKANG